MSLTYGMVKRELHSSSGNGALLVLLDSSAAYWDRVIVKETVLVALEHFGMPYRVLDLAAERPTRESLAGCAGIVIAQNRLGESLSAKETGLIAEAVKQGCGLVNFDNDLRLYKDAYHEIFGFENVNPHAYVTDQVRIRTNSHYITQMQSENEWHKFDRMVSAVIVEKWREDVVSLAEGILGKDQLIHIRHLSPWSAFEPRNYPALFATGWGKGKAVQFTLNPRVWRNAFYGHARGMDDLFWRSIVWAVRKPFTANMIPPFVTMSLDDCSGRHDFVYADVAGKNGFVPMPSLFIRNVPKRLFPKIKKGRVSGKVSYNTHALDYYHLLVYDFGKGELNKRQLKRNFAENDEFWAGVGAKPTVTNRFHWCEYGLNALPFLKERGQTFFCPIMQMGLHKADTCMSDGYWPYNLQTCYYDYSPDDNDFFAFGSFNLRHTEDFLTGCTNYLRENDIVDIEKAAQSAASQIKLGLRSCFSAELVTHEQKLDGMTLDEWDRILGRTNEITKHYEKIFVSHDEIGHYLKGKDGVWIKNAVIDGDQARCTLAGQTKTSLRLSVFRDEDDSVIREYKAVKPFEGAAEF